jgi:hypothetical protein
VIWKAADVVKTLNEKFVDQPFYFSRFIIAGASPNIIQIKTKKSKYVKGGLIEKISRSAAIGWIDLVRFILIKE